MGFCVAYDWYLLRHALPAIYLQADLICLSLDKDRISWSGTRYQFDEGQFISLIREVDVSEKIKIVEESYYLPHLSPMENEVRQRNALAGHMGVGGWHIQLDCDEYFLDFSSFVGYLKALPFWKKRRVNICCPWLVLFKRVESGFLYIDPIEVEKIEYMQIATRDPHYEYGRRNGNFNLYTDALIIHQSWARDADQIMAKIRNWGHSQDFNLDRYFDFWKSLNETNFGRVADFHWREPTAWPRLGYLPRSSVEDLLKNAAAIQFPKLPTFYRLTKNSKTISRLRKLITMMRGK